MTLKDLTRAVAAKTGETIANTERTLEAALGEIKDHLSAGLEVNLHNFGKFKPEEKAARTGRNPSTGQPLEIAAKVVVKFVPHKSFKDKVNE